MQGIVTKFTLKTHPQTEVWVCACPHVCISHGSCVWLQGGLITITGDHLDEVNAATVKFSQTVTDPRAAILPTYNSILGAVRLPCSVVDIVS